VRNKNGEPIGKLLGDGTTLSFGITGNQRLQVLGSDLIDVVLCIEIRKELYENSYGKYFIVIIGNVTNIFFSYKVYDFATSDSSFSQLVPMGMEGFLSNGFVCANFGKLSPSTDSYYPIIRLAEWEDVPYRLLTSSSSGNFRVIKKNVTYNSRADLYARCSIFVDECCYVDEVGYRFIYQRYHKKNVEKNVQVEASCNFVCFHVQF
jgi:hypothetical protein